MPPPTTEYRPVVNSVIAGGTSNVKLTDSKTQGPTFTHNGTFLDFQRQSDPILKQIDRTARKLSIDFGYGKSLGSALLNVGVSAGFWNSSLSAGLSNSSLKQRSFAVLSLSEVFYTIVADMPNAHGYFPPAILDNDRYLAPLVLNKMTEYGEIGYVRSVKYGRRVMIAVSANATEEELRRSLNLDADALVIKFKGGVDDQTRKVWETMDAKVVVIGGKITPALADCVTGGPTNFLHSVNRYLKDTAVFDAQTGPVPVSFEMRYAHDNEPMINYETLEFAGQIVTGRKRAEETIRLTKAVELTATDARLVHEDPEIDTDDWTKVDVRYSLALSSNSRAVDLALTMNAFECESDRRYNWETHIRTAKTIGLYKLANDDPRVILSIDAVSRSDFREEMFGGRLHDWFSFPSFGALREITVHVDGSTGNDVREQGLKAELDLVIKVDRER